MTKSEGETDQDLRDRTQGVLRLIVRSAKIVTGQRPEGGDRFLFARMSQCPERRKRAQFAGKIKRLIIEEGGDPQLIEVEYGTAKLWYNRIKVCSRGGNLLRPRDGCT